MSPQPQPTCRVLYVEDTPEDQRLLREAVSLVRVQIELTSASTADAALAALAGDAQFDVLLLDWNLPAVTGVEFLRAARSSQPTLPVLVLTGEPATVDVPKAAQLGVETIIRKPLTLEDWEGLAERLYRFCSNSLKN
jgi:two-component system, chemotaxis family, chemotaxis protein CheY